jgi:multisubunit Na+/H+ antiporter MnhG subunit
MSIVFGLIFLLIGTAIIALGIQVIFHNKDLYAHNHKITGCVSNAISGSLNEAATLSPVEISKGFTVDMRNRELLPCNQLSRESIG